MRKYFFAIIIFGGLLLAFKPALAGAPAGSYWFQLFTGTQTGSDNTGDGGTGLPADLNYYYVGQSITFRSDVYISAGQPSNGADLIVGYDKNILSGSGLTALAAYQNWTGQAINNGTGEFTISGYNNAGVYYTGQRQYNNITFSMLRPSVASYGSTPTTLNIDFTPGRTTDTNINRNGVDYMDSEEDFNLIVWADTKKPFGLNPNPANGSAAVPVESSYLFDVRDSKNGEGDNSGVGTGFAAPPAGRNIQIFDGSATTSYTGATANALSGTFQTICNATVDPASPLGIGGDMRNWQYNTAYRVAVSGYTDRASASQNQLGDANGPNVMDPKIWTFTTEADTIAPAAAANTPSAGAVNVAITTQVVVDVTDKKSANVSGVGVNPSTCVIRIDPPSWGGAVDLTESSSGVVTSSIPYGVRYTITPSATFSQNEVVSVNVNSCADWAGNMMVSYPYSFTTVDANPPYVVTTSPANDSLISASQNIGFTLLDDGVGVDLSKVVVLINGRYFTSGGGSGSISQMGTNVPVKISFSSSTDFTPYVTTNVVTSGTEYIFSIPGAYNAGEAVPVIIYARDTSNNIMERYVFDLVVEGGSCQAGSSYCGANTSWSGSLCVGTGGGGGGGGCGGGGGGGGGTTAFSINSSNAFVSQINETSVLVTWYSTLPASGRVVYGTSAQDVPGPQPDYGYSLTSNESSDNSTYHSAIISGLKAGTLYYFRPVSKEGGREVLGPELKMAPLFASLPGEKVVCQSTVVEKPVVKTAEKKVTANINQKPVKVIKSQREQINVLNVNKTDKYIKLNGTAAPRAKIKIIIY